MPTLSDPHEEAIRLLTLVSQGVVLEAIAPLADATGLVESPAEPAPVPSRPGAGVVLGLDAPPLAAEVGEVADVA